MTATLAAEEPASPLGPEDVVASEGNIPVKIVGGRLVAHVELSTIHRRVPVDLFIEFDNPCGLRLHDSVAAPPDFPEADRDFFKAMVAKDADQLEAWLEKYPKERLSEEAAQRLLGYRIDEDARPCRVMSRRSSRSRPVRKRWRGCSVFSGRWVTCNRFPLTPSAR